MARAPSWRRTAKGCVSTCIAVTASYATERTLTACGSSRSTSTARRLPESKDPQPYLRALRWLSSLGFLGPDFQGSGRRVDDGGSATIGGTRYRSIFIVDSDAVPMQLFVDPQTALVRFARDVNGDDTFEYRDYRKVDGFTIPFEIRHNGNVLEKYDDRTPVAPPFDPPHGPRPVFAGPARPVPIDPNHVTPVFSCQIGGITRALPARYRKLRPLDEFRTRERTRRPRRRHVRRARLGRVLDASRARRCAPNRERDLSAGLLFGAQRHTQIRVRRRRRRRRARLDANRDRSGRTRPASRCENARERRQRAANVPNTSSRS